MASACRMRWQRKTAEVGDLAGDRNLGDGDRGQKRSAEPSAEAAAAAIDGVVDWFG